MENDTDVARARETVVETWDEAFVARKGDLGEQKFKAQSGNEYAYWVDGALDAAAIGNKMGKAVGDAEMCGHLSAVIGSPEYPYFWGGRAHGMCLHGPEGVPIDQWLAANPCHEITDVCRKMFGIFMGIRIERIGGLAI